MIIRFLLSLSHWSGNNIPAHSHDIFPIGFHWDLFPETWLPPDSRYPESAHQHGHASRPTHPSSGLLRTGILFDVHSYPEKYRNALLRVQ